MEFENGVRSTFHTNINSAIPERRMYINGIEGAIRADVMKGTIELKRIGWDTSLEDVSTGVSGGHGGADDILVEHLFKMMTEDRATAYKQLRKQHFSSVIIIPCSLSSFFSHTQRGRLLFKQI